MEAKQMFFQLSKVDPFLGLAEGIAAAEELDRDNEVLDYDASKPYFQQWSNSQKSVSGGKSLGNIRLQHDPKRPVGRLVDIQFDDVKKQVRVIAKIEETEARNLLSTGVLTGFSIGGSYVSKSPLKNGVTRYVAGPSEISVVDRPCAPSATFSSVKSDGNLELRKFQTTLTKDDLLKQVKRELAYGLPESYLLLKHNLTPGDLYRLRKDSVIAEMNRGNMVERRRLRLEQAFGMRGFFSR